MIDSFLKYLQFEKRSSKHTALAYQNDLNQLKIFLSESFHHEDISRADHGMLRAWIVNLVEGGMDPATVNRKIACLRTFYKYLLREQVLTKDPTVKLRVLKSKKKLPSFVKEADMGQLLDALPADDTMEAWRERLILELFYGTGIRLSELLNLKEGDIDLKQRTIRVTGKRNKQRVIPFSKHLVHIIEGYRRLKRRELSAEGSELLLVTEKGKPCYPMMVQRIVNKALSTTTSTEKKSPHVLRHTYATHLLDKGAEINAVKDLLGHSSLAATQVYTHNSMERLKKAFDQAHPKA